MGHDEIWKLVLRHCSHILSLSLEMIFQTCLNKGTYPKTWKISKVTPIFKAGNKADVTCYRPISLLCCCSKVLEMIFDAIYELVRDQLHASQYGFRKKTVCNATTTSVPGQTVWIVRRRYSWWTHCTIFRFCQSLWCGSAWTSVETGTTLWHRRKSVETYCVLPHHEFKLSKSKIICLTCKM